MGSSRTTSGRRSPAVLLALSLAVFAGAPRNALGDRNDCRWRRLDVGAVQPAARRFMAFVYDAANHRIVLHGGELENGGTEPGAGDIWMLELGAEASGPRWTRVVTEADSVFGRPANRFGHAAAYVPGDSGSPGRMIIQGGKAVTGEIMDDTWELSLGATPRWKRLSGDAFPTNRWHHTAVWFNGAVHVFGGNPSGGMADLWKLNLSTNTWEYLGGPTTIACRAGEDRSGTPTWPDRRYYHSMIVDTNRNRMVVFGGDYESSCVASNMYETASGTGPGCEAVPTTPGTWTKTLNETNQGSAFSRILTGAVFDPVGQRMITVGGFNPVLEAGCLEGALNSVAAVTLPPDGSGWHELLPTGTGPTGIAGQGTVYDPRGDRVILFGGVTGDIWNGPYSNDTWAIEFDLVPPRAVADLDVKQVLADGAVLRWTAPGDDGATGTAFRYEIRYASSPITDEADFAAATPWPTPPTPLAAGQETTVFLPSGPGAVYVALRTWDESGNASPISNLTCFDTSVKTYCDRFQYLGVDPGTGAPALALSRIAPNPSAGAVRVDFDLARRGDASLDVIDLAGRRVASQSLDGFEPGSHSIEMGRGTRLPAGYYVIRLRQAGRSVTKPFIVR